MGQYNKKGMYAGYDKNHKERDALDYYSTPTEEVENILNILDIDFKDTIILEPCAGGGHMIKGILNYTHNKGVPETKIIATDVQERETLPGIMVHSGLQYDFLSDNYPLIPDIDWVIMNPPFSTIEPFVMKSLEIANKGVIMFGRLQFLESEKRYENILKDNPPQDVYVYVDRVACYKNGDTTQKMASVQAYAWFIWDKIKEHKGSQLHWIRRVGK